MRRLYAPGLGVHCVIVAKMYCDLHRKVWLLVIVGVVVSAQGEFTQW